jgi:hypothetical protein
MNLEKCAFKKGSRYKVKLNFTSGGSNFTAGEVLIYDSGGFSPYDNCFVAAFLSQDENKRKDWYNAPDDNDLWQEYLELLSE